MRAEIYCDISERVQDLKEQAPGMLRFMFLDDHETEFDESETLRLVKETMSGQKKDSIYQKRL